MKFLILPGLFAVSPVRVLHTPHVSFVYGWKRQTSDLTEMGNLEENLPTRWRLFPKTRWEYRCHWVCYRRVVFLFRPKEKKRKGVFSKSCDAASMRKWHEKICLSELIRIKFVSWKDNETNVSSIDLSSDRRFSFKKRYDTVSVDKRNTKIWHQISWYSNFRPEKTKKQNKTKKTTLTLEFVIMEFYIRDIDANEYVSEGWFHGST